METLKDVAGSLPEPSVENIALPLTYLRMLLSINYVVYIFVSMAIALAVIILLPKESCIFKKVIALLPALLIVMYRTISFFSDTTSKLELSEGIIDPTIKSTNSILISVIVLLMLVFIYNMANYHRLSFFSIFSGSIFLLVERVLVSPDNYMNIFVYQTVTYLLSSYLHSLILLTVISLIFSYLSSSNSEDIRITERLAHHKK